MPAVSGLGDSVKPLKGSPAVQRNWANLGLPETGWVLVTDKELCEMCPNGQYAPCAVACATEHGLDAQQRLTMGTCAQCDPAPCEDACPVDGILRTAEGAVEIDQELCIGCRFCEDACPEHALMLISPYAVETPPQGLEGYTAGRPTGDLPNTVAKCTMCSYRMLAAQMPICVEACPLGAIWVGNLDRDTAANRMQVQRLTQLLDGRMYEVLSGGRRTVYLVG